MYQQTMKYNYDCFEGVQIVCIAKFEGDHKKPLFTVNHAHNEYPRKKHR